MSFKIDPNAYYSPDDTEKIIKNKKATLAAKRSRGEGIPYSKVGRSIFYKGKTFWTN